MTKTGRRKINRKTKRVIRRSIAAVMMITAIAVAAIPVPDIQADNGTGSSSSSKRENITDNRTPCVYDVTGQDLDLDPDGILTPPANAIEEGAGKNTYRTYRIRRSANGSEWELNWQFKYYLTNVQGAQKGIISEYNNSYLENNVNLGNLSATQYYTVSESTYEQFYASGEGSKTHTLSYETDYVPYRQSGGGADNLIGEAKWFSQYFKSAFDAYWTACEKYYDAKKLRDEWEANPDRDSLPEPPVPDPIEPSISRTPGVDFDAVQKYKFYCDMDTELSRYGTGYTLERVIDASNSAGGISNYIYVAQGSGATVQNGSLDEFGFLVIEKSIGIVGIAKEAFAGVTKIDTIILPDELIYLGDGAFNNSFIKNINLNSVENIGNRAFQNCTQLKNVTFTSAVKNIGTEAFSNIGAESITFTYSVEEIGPGSFSNCKNLASVDMSELQDCVIDNFAFYNCYDLDSVKMDNAGITAIKDGAFAVSSGVTGNWVNVVLPAHISDSDGLGDWLFAGRSNLQSVVFPSDMGSNAGNAVTLPASMFNSCAALNYIEFPDTGSKSCGYITYEPCMFLDVTNKDFYVRGPETRLDGEIADPRKATWKAVSGVSDFVPYVYKDASGVEYYEVSDGMYLLTANAAGTLTSCKLSDGSSVPSEGLDLVIPSQVGNYKIKALASDCFADEEIRNAIGTITIEDNSISEIANSTFQNLPKLRSVVIGNSVTKIGDRAFDGCNLLTEVTFNSPANGDYTGFQIGTDAFRTGSSELTFRGDIVEGYAPFDWAMEASNFIDKDLGIRVCYKSLSPTNLTVLYDNKTGERTLVDYPKYKDLDTNNTATIRQLEAAFYQQYGTNMNGTTDMSPYASKREAFLNYWNDTLQNDPDAEDPYGKEDLYGPWVTPEWVAGQTWTAWGTESAPQPYFDKYPYSIRECYENPGNFEWKTLTPRAQALVNSTVKIVVPKGIDSIDARGYMQDKSNLYNVYTYLSPGKTNGLSQEVYSMYQDSLTDSKDNEKSVPGLFSGLYQDYSEDTDMEKKLRGNDRIEEIVLESVKWLPDYAFDSCENLKSVTIGPDCKDIGNTPFRGCDSLPDVTFQNNEKYKANKGIIYSVNADGTYTIEECLPYRGSDAQLAPPVVNLANDPDLSNVSSIREGAFEDCNKLTSVDLSDASKLTKIPEGTFKNCTLLARVFLPATVNRIESEAFAGDTTGLTVTIPGREVHIATDAFEHTPQITIRSYEDSAAHEYADYHGLNWENLAETFQVIFLDHDGTQLGDTQYVEEGKNAVPPADPTWKDHKFTGWSGDYNNIVKDTILIAQYENTKNNSGGNKPGGNTGGDGKSYTVTVVNGSGGGTYLSGTTVSIVANAPAAGKKFTSWTTSDGVTFANASASTTTFTMPTKNVTVTANYGDDKNNGNGNKDNSGKNNTVSGNQSNRNNQPNKGATTVTINKPGISNTDKSSATVNGSNDNFIVRITETAEATQAVEAALTAEYGSLENVQYFAMDITLWDSTGTTKITDTTGITVDITIPIPDALKGYAGNNRVAGVVDNKLDKLSPKFTTIDGVPCITFRATHFSPYTIYVNTNNLTAGTMQDSTPKTGDGIHPKWFLAVGLASVSIILFLKKDKTQPKRKARLA